jgi:hypothetical protein
MNPTGGPSFGSPPPGAGGPVDAAGAKEQVNVPSLILLIGAIGGILMQLMGIVQNAIGKTQVPEQLLNDPNMRQFLPMFENLQKFGIVFNLLGIGVCAFVAFGAMKMRNLQGWSLSLAACIVGIVPCCYSCCCIFTMIGGIWGLVVLNKPEVKGAFTG